MSVNIELVTRKLTELIQREHREAVTRRIPTSSFAGFFDQTSAGHAIPKERLELELLYRNLRKFDQTDDTPRSIQQKQFHDLFVAASVKNIYKKKFVTQYSAILRENPQFGGDLNQNVIVTCPRRFGKTFGTAMFVAAYLLSISNAEVAIFSPSRRQSTMLLEKVDMFIQTLGEEARIITKNQEKLFVAGTTQRDIRKSFYYPAAINSLRGVSGKTIILEELAALPSRVWFEVILPLLQIDDAYILGISTVQGEENFMSKYLEQKDQFGDPFFRVFQFFGVCLDCRNAGLAEECEHVAHLRPSWHSTGKLKRIKMLYKGNEDVANQELSGVSTSTNKRAFAPRYIKVLMNSSRLPLPGFLQFVFVAIDPCGSGNSNLAICSAYMKHGRQVIFGLDTVPCKTIEEAYGGIGKHVSQIRADKGGVLANATIVFILENNLAFEAQHIAKYVSKKFNNLIIMQQKDKLGLHTNNSFKRGSAILVRNQLQTGMLGFSAALFSTAKPLQVTLDQFVKELSEYREVVEHSTSVFGRTKITFTGKINHGVDNDDLVIALCLSSYWSNQFYISEDYARYHV